MIPKKIHYAIVGLVTVFALFGLTPQAHALGVSARPSEIDVSVARGREERTTLLVSNPSRDVALFDVYPDSFDRAISIEPASFVLEAGDQRRVTVTVGGVRDERFETTLSVVSRPLSGRDFSAATGVKIPLRVAVEKGGGGSFLSALASVPPTLQVFGLVDALLVLVLFVLFIRRRPGRV